MTIAEFVRANRRKLHLTQPQMAVRAGVGLRFMRELERGKPTLRIDKINDVLKVFGGRLVATDVPETRRTVARPDSRKRVDLLKRGCEAVVSANDLIRRCLSK
ncbi:MAG: hypothetical protein MJ025_02055 [Victivallaceae bacterium]|nr:hypothetical protein [Victivallaceae bacterium]